MSLTIILVEKNATLKPLTVKDFKESELFKKCGFKKSEDFQKQTQWTCNGYEVSVYGKTNGRANNENKYDLWKGLPLSRLTLTAKPLLCPTPGTQCSNVVVGIRGVVLRIALRRLCVVA